MSVNPFERFFETLLWSIRRIVVLPVLVSLLLSLGVFLVTTIDALVLAGNMLEYVNPALEEPARNGLRLQTISQVVAVVDGYLLAAILLIFALGLYELFVSKINQAEGSEFAERLLLIQSLDDLKNRLANVILLILIVKFFQVALSQKYTSPLDLLYLAVGLILVAGALYLSGRAKPAKSPLKSSDQVLE
ncbi:MAG TPA: YqhA family protein [Phototrophicaceae bacterium]|nr:YqhA family protein [Phototrophicaceae bacterium]